MGIIFIEFLGIGKIMKNKCRCRPPKKHSYCAYCRSLYGGDFICGICKEAGIDGKVIRGTGRVICSKHKQLGDKKWL